MVVSQPERILPVVALLFPTVFPIPRQWLCANLRGSSPSMAPPPTPLSSFSGRETLFPTAGTIAPHRWVGTKTATRSPRAGLPSRRTYTTRYNATTRALPHSVPSGALPSRPCLPPPPPAVVIPAPDTREGHHILTRWLHFPSGANPTHPL
ncbi:hypothetical protein IV203_023041 [Nitzschia inconspicua]|uniref:Uncharacterized protein n=1 Tax=Nitzschia inconspicua TaxID=303405 RepID=A0A9K3KCF5_9STRA|nr:hypothetical protein IV203_023041 [Nitzschia inconspicua]